MECYEEVGDSFANALFDSCMAEWGTGPSTTWMRLNSSVKDHILHAWQHNDLIEGVLLLRKDIDEYTPLWIHRPSLAHKLSDKQSLWINFRAIKESMTCP